MKTGTRLAGGVARVDAPAGTPGDAGQPTATSRPSFLSRQPACPSWSLMSEWDRRTARVAAARAQFTPSPLRNAGGQE